jgi:hypothetical protein
MDECMAILYDKQALFAVHAAEEAWEQGYMYMYIPLHSCTV